MDAATKASLQEATEFLRATLLSSLLIVRKGELIRTIFTLSMPIANEHSK